MSSFRNYNFFLIPVVQHNIDLKYGLFQSHRLYERIDKNYHFDFLEIEEIERFYLSELVNLAYIEKTFYISDGCYYFRQNCDFNVQFFDDIETCNTAQELLLRLDMQFTTGLFNSNKLKMLNMLNKLREMATAELIEETSDDGLSELVSFAEKEKKAQILLNEQKKAYKGASNVESKHRKDHFEVLYEKCRQGSPELGGFNNIAHNTTLEEFKQKVQLFLRFGHYYLSNILPYWYSNEYAKSLFDNSLYQQWEKEKMIHNAKLSSEDIAYHEAVRLPKELTRQDLKLIITYGDKDKIWEHYCDLHREE